MKAEMIKQILVFCIAILIMITSMPIMFEASQTTYAVENLSGTLGENNGFSWSFDKNTSTVTLIGDDEKLTMADLPASVLEAEHYVFENCKFNDSLSYLFNENSFVKSVRFINCDTSNVTDMSGMFYYCTNLTSLDLSCFDTSNVANMWGMFLGCSNLNSLNLSSFNTSNVTNMSSMFEGCSSLTTLNLSGFNTSNVISMNGMFSNCSSLKELNLSNFNTSNVINMEWMFWNCSSLSNLDLSNFNTANVLNMKSMFVDCTGLTSLNVSSFDTYKVTNMALMFQNCSSLTSLDLSGFDLSGTLYLEGFLTDCTSLQTICTPKNMMDRFSIILPSTYETECGEFIKECTVKHCNMILRKSISTGQIGDNNQFKWVYDSSVKTLTVEGAGVLPYQWCPIEASKAEKIVFKNCVFDKSLSELLNGNSIVKSVEFINCDSSKVTDMSAMFSNCTYITNINFNNLNTSNVTNMCGMFSGCSRLASLDLSKFDTSKVTNMQSMFWDCSALKNLDLSNFNTSKVTNMSYMFDDCSNLVTLDVSSFDTSNVTVMWYMFFECCNLESLDLSSFDVSNVPDLMAMLEKCNRLQTICIPKKMSNTAQLELPSKYYTPSGEEITKCTAEHAGIVLSKNKVSVVDKPYKITNVVSGVHVYWNSVEDAVKYGLWRSENGKDGDYKWVANPTVPHFTDTKVVSGKTYFYKVSVLDTETNIHSPKSEAIGIVFTSTPDITSRFNKGAGVQLGWEKIPGATGYGIYRKSYSGNDAWVRIATINSGDTLSYIDSSVKGNNGKVYKYTIRALAGAGNKTLSGCRNNGRSMVRLESRVLSRAIRTNSSSVKCIWTTSSTVTGYEVRFMVGNKVEKIYTIGNYKIGTKTFTGLKSGCSYKVQVRSYKKVDGVGTFYSAWSEANMSG